ncbi:glycoside hydrolase family 15 protein [Frateuria aurantia]|uniref:Glycosyl hydrolase, glucoamylase n=1 Tax=Frateuria aurantia (strain ATCC 33424 / DSM 6220 / KCTC 2777 / LMG 1558 / NBRC 3245 / NCIMB 13370) TaxID=767434 RepID=H8L164_FRAAD|nr:glycoside hydrolase family 15 protein [Frateuria aurantia]AFC87219.1 glycosyl hydrolase, glucoamylase [Frateuria aurantia DSM 6220]
MPAIPPAVPTEQTLDLGVIGNGSIAVLINRQGDMVWGCLPRFDADASFCALLSPRLDGGYWKIELEDLARSEQDYLPNTAVLRTRLFDSQGNGVEIRDFVPRFHQHERLYCPVQMIRQLIPIGDRPRIRVRLRPLCDYGARVPERTLGSNHIRLQLSELSLRLTCDVPVQLIERELPFALDRTAHLILGPDETLTSSPAHYAGRALEGTLDYWRQWVRHLHIPYEWQDAVIRAAITLKLCQYQPTGAIVAALTTSIPEAPDTARNWDYRYCWLRDATFTVRALNRLGATHSMEKYISYVFNLLVQDDDDEVGPVFGISFESGLTESQIDSLAGYRGMGPVRIGNDAWRQRQNDVYGSVVLASAQLFFDRRLSHPGDGSTFRRLESMGRMALRMAEVPDAGLWEFRGRAAVHTYSAAMCWAACDRLAHIATALGLDERARHWHDQATGLHARILARCWSPQRGHFVDTYDGDQLDASLLLLAEIGFVEAGDPRFVATVEAIGEALGRGSYLFRYIAPDDFGSPETSFNICTFWYIEALVAIGRRQQARGLFENMVARRNRLGLLSEDIAPADGTHWGNFPQTYSLVGLIQSAMRLSARWEDSV